MTKTRKQLPRPTGDLKTVSTLEQVAAAYGGWGALARSFGGLSCESSNGLCTWLRAGAPPGHRLGLYVGLQRRGYQATPELFGAASWKEVCGAQP